MNKHTERLMNHREEAIAYAIAFYAQKVFEYTARPRGRGEWEVIMPVGKVEHYLHRYAPADNYRKATTIEGAMDELIATFFTPEEEAADYDDQYGETMDLFKDLIADEPEGPEDPEREEAAQALRKADRELWANRVISAIENADIAEFVKHKTRADIEQYAKVVEYLSESWRQPQTILVREPFGDFSASASEIVEIWNATHPDEKPVDRPGGLWRC